MDDEESARLAKRFDQQWLPDNQAELHARLLAQGVLARVENEELASGAMLSPQELEALSRFDSLEGIEIDRLLEAINQRLAGDAERNERIIERLRKAAERSILLFANSVVHAAELSARLSNMLFDREIAFEYEKPLYAPDGSFYLPDFTILWRGERYFWEHLGMLERDDYRRKWETKQAWYEKHFSGKLVTTEESGNLSIKAKEVIEKHFA